MPGKEIESLIFQLARLPGLGPRSGQRVALHLLRHPDAVMRPLLFSLQNALEAVRPCPICGNPDSASPCSICANPGRDASLLCIVQDIPDLWALERTNSFKGRYHLLGGLLSALDAVGPEQLNLSSLPARLESAEVSEVILALPATVDGQTTAYYITDLLRPFGVKISALANGVPVGGELDYLDEGTILAALKSRRSVSNL